MQIRFLGHATSTSPGGTVNTPAGLVISMGGEVVYHLGDTALFSDLALPGRRNDIDVALMCIGGHARASKSDVEARTSSQVVVLEPGESHSV